MVYDNFHINSYYSELKKKHIVPVTFLLSIIIHVTAIMAFQGVFPITVFRSKLRAYKVDLIRPPVKEIMKGEEKKPPPVSQIHSKPPVEPKEATISLDTRDSTYHPYTKVLKEMILNRWIYPLSARQAFIQGSLLIVFRLDRGGNLIACNMATSSGHEILDAHALQAIRLASPFPPFPENIMVQFLNINASFVYRLKFD